MALLKKNRCFCFYLFVLVLPFSLNGVIKASTVKEYRLEGKKELSQGSFKNTRLLENGQVVLAQRVKTLASGLGASTLTLAVHQDKEIFFAGSSGGEIYSINIEDGIKKAKKEERIISLKVPMITKILTFGKNRLLVLSAPKSKLFMLTLQEKTSESGSRIKKVDTLELKNVNFILDAMSTKDGLYLVGGGREGLFIHIDRPFSKTRKVNVLTKVAEKSLRSIARNSFGDFYLGSGEKGRIYKYSDKKLSVIYESKGNEVSDILIDHKNRVFASIIDVDGNMRMQVTSEKKADLKAKTKSIYKVRKVSASSLVRIDPDFNTEVLWFSKQHAAYALSFKPLSNFTKIVLATGPKGRLFEVGSESGMGWSILQEVKRGQELLTLSAYKNGLIMSSALFSGVHYLSAETVKEGFYFTPIINTSRLSTFGVLNSNIESTRWLRSGFTASANKFWGQFRNVNEEEQMSEFPPSQYVQGRIQLKPGQELSFVSLSYLQKNSAPVIQGIDILQSDWFIENKMEYSSQQKSLQLGKSAFKKILMKRKYKGRVLDEVNVQQTKREGIQSFYVHVEDLDKDVLLYRYAIQKVGDNKWSLVKKWGQDAFLSLSEREFSSGSYKLKVEVTDRISNADYSKATDQMVSSIFQLNVNAPIIEAEEIINQKNHALIQFKVRASNKLLSVKCASKENVFINIPPVDGILDENEEEFFYKWPILGKNKAAKYMNCLATDLNGKNTSFRLKE